MREAGVTIDNMLQVASLASLAQLLPPRSSTWVTRCRIALCAELLLPDCVRFSCCFSRDCIDPFQLLLSSRLASASAAFRRLRPLQLLVSIAVNWFPIASASAAAPRMPTLLPDGVRFVCCSPIASASAAAPRQLFSKIPAWCLEHSTQSSRFKKYEGRASSPAPQTSHFRYTQTHG